MPGVAHRTAARVRPGCQVESDDRAQLGVSTTTETQSASARSMRESSAGDMPTNRAVNSMLRPSPRRASRTSVPIRRISSRPRAVPRSTARCLATTLRSSDLRLTGRSPCPYLCISRGTSEYAVRRRWARPIVSRPLVFNRATVEMTDSGPCWSISTLNSAVAGAFARGARTVTAPVGV